MSEDRSIGVHVVNPLPMALSHYEAALLDALDAPALPRVTRDDRAPSVELGRTGGRMRRSLAVLGHRAQCIRGREHLLVLWPSFGHLDWLFWPGTRAERTVTVVVHDPVPLRAALGYGAVGRWVGVAAQARANLVTHSAVAKQALQAQGYRNVRHLPLPLAAATGMSAVSGCVIRVLGQYKEARDLTLLVDLAKHLRQSGAALEIWGRGWPDVPGWSVHPGFLPEAEFAAKVATSSVVLLPYKRYFSSDVAVRALEACVPAVGHAHPFLNDLYGPGWVGAIRTGDPATWARTLLEVAEQPKSHLRATRDARRRQAADAWQEWAGGVWSGA